jgi:hypothetical protein
MPMPSCFISWIQRQCRPKYVQVFDRHIQDFKRGFLRAFLSNVQQWFSHTEVVSGYVFEPQRKAAIGYFQLRLSRNG